MNYSNVNQSNQPENDKEKNFINDLSSELTNELNSVEFNNCTDDIKVLRITQLVDKTFENTFNAKFLESKEYKIFNQNFGKNVNDAHSKLVVENKKSFPRVVAQPNGSKLLWGITAAAVIGFVGLAFFGKSPEVIGRVMANSTGLINKVADSCSISLTQKQLYGMVAGALTLVGLGFIVNKKHDQYTKHKNDFKDLQNLDFNEKQDKVQPKGNAEKIATPLSRTITEVKTKEISKTEIFRCFETAATDCGLYGELKKSNDGSIMNTFEGIIKEMTNQLKDISF